MYELIIERKALKSLKKIAPSDRKRIIQAIYVLQDNPRPTGSKKLSGREGWRIRSGQYRIIYEIYDKESKILIKYIGHRGQIYNF